MGAGVWGVAWKGIQFLQVNAKGMGWAMGKRRGRVILVPCKKMQTDDRGAALVTVIMAMALVGMLAATLLWVSCLNYRIKINDLKAKNSFYSAEMVVEQIAAGIKRHVVSKAINEAYQEVVSNWDALGTEANRESYFVTEYIEAVEKKLNVTPADHPNRYDKSKLRGYVDEVLWDEGGSESKGHIVNQVWEDAVPVFQAANVVNGYGSMVLKNICIEFCDSDGYVSVINTDIAIDVPKLRFTQAGTVDRLYPYVLIGGTGIETADATTVDINGSIYGGVNDLKEGGIQIGEHSRVTVEEADYIISGGDIVVGNSLHFAGLVSQGAHLTVRDWEEDGKGFKTGIYARGLVLNGSSMDVSGRMYVANDLTLSGIGSKALLSGQYYGYGGTNTADLSSAVVINGKDSTVDLTGLTALVLAGRAYVSLPGDGAADNGLAHVLTGESISVKSNQIAYLVPPECIGTLEGRTVIGQNPVSFAVWSKMMESLSQYTAKGQDFRIVDADRALDSLGGEKLNTYGMSDIRAEDLGGIDTSDIVQTVAHLNQAAAAKGVRLLYMPEQQQVYLYLAMDEQHAAEYFTQYYHVDSNKVRLDSYFNQYVSGGIKLRGNVEGYTVAGNSMVSVTDAATDGILTSEEGQNLVGLLPGIGEDQEGMSELIAGCSRHYHNLNVNLMEEDAGTENTVFENLVRLSTPPDAPKGVAGLQDYLDEKGGKAEFSAGNGLKAVLVDSESQPDGAYHVADSRLRLVIAIGDVEVEGDFQGLVIASGKITITKNATVKKDGEGVYDVLLAKCETGQDSNVPADILYNGQGMVWGGYEEADVNESGNLNIDYAKIVRYENWVKK